MNSKNHRVERNGGGFQRRLELENRLYAFKPSLPCHLPTLGAPVHAYAHDPGALLHVCAAPASRAHPLLQAICSHALSRVFQEPKTLPEYKYFEPSDPLNPSPGKTHIFSFEAPPSRSRPLYRFASMCTPTHRITTNTKPGASFIPCSTSAHDDVRLAPTPTAPQPPPFTPLYMPLHRPHFTSTQPLHRMRLQLLPPPALKRAIYIVIVP